MALVCVAFAAVVGAPLVVVVAVVAVVAVALAALGLRRRSVSVATSAALTKDTVANAAGGGGVGGGTTGVVLPSQIALQSHFHPPPHQLLPVSWL